jgi:predicted MFS family arabinose efflux permease
MKAADSVASPQLLDTKHGQTDTQDLAHGGPPAKLLQPPIAALAGTLLLAVVLGIGRFAYTPLLPWMQDALGWTVQQAGDVASANYLGYMLGALLAGALAQRRERPLWLLTGMILAALSILAGAWVTSFPLWLAIRFVAGVASALGLVIGTAIVMEFLTARGRPQLGALHFAGIGTGIIASVLILEVARRIGLSVFGQWGALGLVSVVLLIASWALLRQLPSRSNVPPSSAAQAKQPKQPLFTRRFTRLSIAYGFFGFGYVITATFIVAMARRLEHAALLEALTWLIVGLAAAPSVFMWQRVAQRFNLFTALRIAYAVQATGVLLAGFGSSQLALLIGGACLGGTFVGMTALGLAAARQTAKSDQAMGWVTALFGLGQLLGPAIAGRLAQMTQSFAVPSLVAAILLVVGIVLLWGLENS